MVGKAQTAFLKLDNMEGKVISVWKPEVRLQHQETIWSLGYTYLLAKSLAQVSLKSLSIQSHQNNPICSGGTSIPAALKSLIKQANAPSTVL